MEGVSDTAVFVRVVAQGSFTAAADSLGLSKGAVSKYVGRLEQRLGARLLNRTTRRLTLTEAGEAFYARAMHALAELEEAEHEVGRLAGRPRGYLRVTAPTFYGAEILSRHLSEFQTQYPDISLDLILDNRLVDLVNERIDVAVRMSAPRDSSLVMRKLAEIPMITCASPAYVAKHGRPETPADLRAHNCLIYALSARPNEWVFRSAAGRRFVVDVRGNLRTNDDHTMRRAALDGLGILRMPRLFLEDAIQRGELVSLWADTWATSVTLALVYPSRQALPAKIRVFVDFVAGLATTC